MVKGFSILAVVVLLILTVVVNQRFVPVGDRYDSFIEGEFRRTIEGESPFFRYYFRMFDLSEQMVQRIDKNYIRPDERYSRSTDPFMMTVSLSSHTTNRAPFGQHTTRPFSCYMADCHNDGGDVVWLSDRHGYFENYGNYPGANLQQDQNSFWFINEVNHDYVWIYNQYGYFDVYRRTPSGFFYLAKCSVGVRKRITGFVRCNSDFDNGNFTISLSYSLEELSIIEDFIGKLTVFLRGS